MVSNSPEIVLLCFAIVLPLHQGILTVPCQSPATMALRCLQLCRIGLSHFIRQLRSDTPAISPAMPLSPNSLEWLSCDAVLAKARRMWRESEENQKTVRRRARRTGETNRWKRTRGTNRTRKTKGTNRTMVTNRTRRTKRTNRTSRCVWTAGRMGLQIAKKQEPHSESFRHSFRLWTSKWWRTVRSRLEYWPL